MSPQEKQGMTANFLLRFFDNWAYYRQDQTIIEAFEIERCRDCKQPIVTTVYRLHEPERFEFVRLARMIKYHTMPERGVKVLHLGSFCQSCYQQWLDPAFKPLNIK